MANLVLQRVQTKLAASRRVTTRFTPLGELVITDAQTRASILVIEKRVEGESTVVFLAHICEESSSSARQLLRLAAELGAGSVALVGGSYVSRYCIPAASVDTTDCERIALYVDRLARSLRDALFAMRADVSGITHLVH